MELLTIIEVANFLKTSPQTIQRYITNGKIVAAKVFGQWRISREEVNKLLNIVKE